MRPLRLLSVAIVTLGQNEFYTCDADAAGGSDSDTHPHPDPDVLSSDLLDWLRTNGAFINEKLVLKHIVPDDPSSPRGVFATEAMEAGETICNIPSNLIVESREELMGGLPAEMSYCGTIKAVMEATSGDDMTPYGRYLAAQPIGYLPKFWSDTGKELLMEMLMSTGEEQLTGYDELPPHGVYDSFEELERECQGDIKDPLYLQAAMLVSARSDYDKMVPFYDMINHHNSKYNIRHNVDPYQPNKQINGKGYDIVTAKAIQAGDELYNSYNHCNVCNEYWDWFGTPEMFLNFGFVEPLPQRWLIDFARVKFDLDWKDGDERMGDVVLNFLVPPSETGIDMLRHELGRLESFSSENRDENYEDYEGVSKFEWESIWQYYDALHDALSHAVQSNATLSDDVWDLDDDWWVKDGKLVAADVGEHYVLPTRSVDTSNDEL